MEISVDTLFHFEETFVDIRRRFTIDKVLALLVLLTCSALPGRAIVVATNLGPGDTFSSNGILIENFFINGEVTGFAVAFVPGISATLQDVALPLSTDLLGSLTVGIASDAGGQPGAVITLLAQNGSISVASALVTFSCTNCPLLQANSQYWIVAVPANPNTEATWQFSPSALGNASF